MNEMLDGYGHFMYPPLPVVPPKVPWWRRWWIWVKGWLCFSG